MIRSKTGQLLFGRCLLANSDSLATTNMAKKKSASSAKVKQARAGSAASARQQPGRRYWLIKSEPLTFSLDDLARSPEQTTFWDGVRNYQARNMLRDEMKRGDLVLFHHSNADPPGIAGVVKVVREGYPDHTAFDPNNKHFDPKSKKSDPRWFMIDVQLVEKFPRELSLADLKQLPELDGMVLLQKGSRLSVQPVSEDHFKLIRKLSKKK